VHDQWTAKAKGTKTDVSNYENDDEGWTILTEEGKLFLLDADNTNRFIKFHKPNYTV